MSEHVLTYAERRALRPGAPPVLETLLDAGPDELVVEHAGAETPHVRQAGTLGETQSPEGLVALVRQEAERSLYYFNLVFMGGHTLMVPHVQGRYCDFLQHTPPWKKLLLAPRGTLKTTITKGLILHMLIQPMGANIYFPHGKIGYLPHNEGTSTRILLASQGAKLSQDKLIELRTWIEMSELLRAFWPQCFWTDPRRQATAWNNERLFLPRRDIFKEATIETTGVDAKVTGSHYNVGLYDDLIGEEDRFSVATMERTYNWIAAVPALLDDREYHAHEIFLGTHWSNNDIYVRMKRDDIRLDHRTFSAIQEDGQALWPEIYPLEALKSIEADLIQRGKGDLYALNYLNDPHHSSIVAFNAGMLRYFRIEGDKVLLDDDPRDLALTLDFVQGQAGRSQIPVGTRLTPETYRQHRHELREGLKALYFKDRALAGGSNFGSPGLDF
jgi:hypothetical protein